MDDTRADGNLSNNNGKIKDEFDNCTDDKVSVYDTVISGGYIKQEPCDTEDEGGNSFNYDNIKDEIIEDRITLVQETGLVTNTKYCEECCEEYNLYCLKCAMLIRIFDSNNTSPLHNRVRWTLPTKIIDIRETLSGVAMIALRAIPKGVVFGPFEGLDSTKDGTVSKWKLKYNMLVYTKDFKQVNWMQYIRRADQSSNWNLTAFQYEDELYYRSDCHINIGDELLVYLDSGKEKSGIEVMEDGYWKPQVCERLDDAYACTFCCVGYKSIHHLEAHNSSCPEKENQKDFCKEIMQCAFCKIYLDEKEYLDYHIDACCGKNSKKYRATLRSPKDTDKPDLKDKYNCTICEYSTSQKRTLSRHQVKHIDLQMYKCPECPYRARQKHFMQQHVRTHANCDRSLYVCKHCGERFSHTGLLVLHQKKMHSVPTYRCHNCAFETTNRQDFRRHMATHKDDKSYLCNKCDKQFKTSNLLVAHVRIYHRKRKEYKCPKCDFETINSTSMKNHMLNVHEGARQFKCRRCVYKTYYKKTFDRHLEYHEDTKPTKCKTYDLEFWNKRLLVRYKKVAHTSHNEDKRFACALCGYKTTKKSHLKQHVAVHCDDRPFQCDICQRMFKRATSLRRHTRNIHSKTKIRNKAVRTVRIIIKPFLSADKKYAAATPPENIDKPRLKDKYKCCMCEYSTFHKSAFSRHRLTHTGSNPYKCTQCPYLAPTKHSMQQHVRTHINCDSSRYECKQCGERFSRFDLLSLHQKIKHSVSVYKCYKCVFETANAQGLRQHISTHKEAKSYSCNTCGKRFETNNLLLAHIRRYHNEKKKEYKCPKCDFETIYQASMKSHMLTIHAGIQRFKCTRCSFKTCYKLTLDRHVLYHENAKPIKCQICDIEFWHIRSFVRHKKERHVVPNDDKAVPL